MTNDLEAVLYRHFGYESFRQGQKESIESALAGKDTLVVLPTGSGKSICYQLFPYLKTGTTLVISPLISLMQDQVNKIRITGEKAVCSINSSLTSQERHYIYNHIDQYRFIFLSPEMLSQARVISMLAKISINLLVVDEAHCVTQWGMDFRPDYLQIAHFRQALGQPTIMALTATATEKVQSEIKELLAFDLESSTTISRPVDRREIKYVFEKVEDKDGRLLEIVKQIQKPGIIYFSSKKQADKIARLLTDHGIEAESYHSDKSDLDKMIIQNQFLSNQLQVVCATQAFGMGVDKKDIRFVIHYHMPADPEMYLQEVGRCSRDGQDGVAITLYKDGDESLQKLLKLESLPSSSTIQYIFENNKRIQHIDDSQYKIVNYFHKNNYSLSATTQFFKNRQSLLSNQIYFMKDLVETPTCKREFILSYFGEVSTDKDGVCCSSCDKNLLNHFEDEVDSHSIKLEVQSANKILQSIYNRM